MQVAIAITDEQITGLLSCALDTGYTAYWGRYAGHTLAKDSKVTEFPYLYAALEPGGSLRIRVDDEKTYKITRKKIEKALALMAEHEPRHFADFMAENEDATTGDVFLQLCCFGKVIYG